MDNSSACSIRLQVFFTRDFVILCELVVKRTVCPIFTIPFYSSFPVRTGAVVIINKCCTPFFQSLCIESFYFDSACSVRTCRQEMQVLFDKIAHSETRGDNFTTIL